MPKSPLVTEAGFKVIIVITTFSLSLLKESEVVHRSLSAIPGPDSGVGDLRPISRNSQPFDVVAELYGVFSGGNNNVCIGQDM